MNRNVFTIALSDDGSKFSKMYRLIDEPTRQRYKGHLKVDGYQAPSCVVEGERLLVAFSVNKEDIEIGMIDTTKLS